MTNKNFLPLSPINADNEVWLPAIYNGRPIKGMIVSNYGWFRRETKAGGYGQESKGTPNFNKQNRNRLRQFGVSVTWADWHEGEHRNTTVNLHRIICCTFQDAFFGPGYEVDHIDRNVANSFVGTPEGDFKDGNLRCVTRAVNQLNKGIIRRKYDTVASDYGYKMRLQFGVRRIADLPVAYRREYYRLLNGENAGRQMTPRTIDLKKGASK